MAEVTRFATVDARLAAVLAAAGHKYQVRNTNGTVVFAFSDPVERALTAHIKGDLEVNTRALFTELDTCHSQLRMARLARRNEERE